MNPIQWIIFTLTCLYSLSFSLNSFSSSKSRSRVWNGSHVGDAVDRREFSSPKYSLPCPSTAQMYSSARFVASTSLPADSSIRNNSAGFLRLYDATSQCGRKAPSPRSRAATALCSVLCLGLSYLFSRVSRSRHANNIADASPIPSSAKRN